LKARLSRGLPLPVHDRIQRCPRFPSPIPLPIPSVPDSLSPIPPVFPQRCPRISTSGNLHDDSSWSTKQVARREVVLSEPLLHRTLVIREHAVDLVTRVRPE